ncbi:MAG TPA: ATP-binding protein [Candidatus Mediterraneibacter caccavium]|uniref:ATP-binding protein n=1 Tax=Candidatus Mediterraneibacter caccavium TaxID=2838661 RepID=A0A9D1VW27_9FIRM|nr:ATP-binding protein [Candidatus Mediterraneibacter caccavium]
MKCNLSKAEVYCYNIEYTKEEEAVSMEFREKCPEIAGTDLWKIFEKKAGDDHEFIAAVGEICYDGVILSKDVIRFFPIFTLHDGTHLAGVCKWMIRLLGDKKDDLTFEEAAMLVMAACCHDIGMSVSDDQRKELEAELATGDYTEEWLEYFRKYPGDEVAYHESRTVTEEMLRKYIRENHSRRISEQLPHEWPDALTRRGIHRETLIRVCESHGESLSELLDRIPLADCDLNLCVVLLRLADLLDYDAARAPENLFRHLGLDHPETAEQKTSREEWKKNRSGWFGEIREGIIPYTARFADPQTEHEVMGYLAWLRSELILCNEFLSRFSKRWQGLELPYRVVENVERVGYEAGDFHLTMDQDRILELLTGENLYSDPGVFVRELLQNAIDAVLTRRRLDPGFGEKGGKIVVHTWMDNEGYGWFRIEDDGIGMDEHIVKDYFLKVGRSYYTSDEYKAAMIHKVRDTDFTPTSRFGIGILSCFMSDPDNNRLEVVTRRYSPGPGTRNPVYRLDVTGLHGYYFLTEVKKGRPGQPMHRPMGADGTDDGYMHRVGTTICVRVNMYRMGGPRAFKDLMDKYVCFPEVPVEFHGPEGTYTYPTQQELMDLVHSMNPDGPGAEPKEYEHPITDEMFDELKREMTFVKWEISERPALVLKYYPLDWLSGTENISGVAIKICIKDSMKCELVKYQENEYPVEVCADSKVVYFQNKIMIRLKSFCPDNHRNRQLPKEKGYLLDAYKKTVSFNIPFKDLLSMLSEEEAPIFMKTFVSNAVSGDFILKNNEDHGTCAAYNGVLSDTSDLLDIDREYMNSIILLSGVNCPGVNMARNIITSLPLETFCNLVRIRDILNDWNWLRYYSNTGLLYDKSFALTEAWRFRSILERHPDWEDQIQIRTDILSEERVSLSELEGMLKNKEEVMIDEVNRNPYDLLCLAALKRRFTVWIDFSNNWDGRMILKSGKSHLEEFPVILFFHPMEMKTVFLGRISIVTINYYNQEHRFSMWLIKNRKELQDKVPGMYNNILTTMILETEISVIVKELNDILERLKQFPGNPFNISRELYLSEGDFIKS